MAATTTDSQREVTAFLSTPQAYGHSTLPIERIDTHISIVWLAGERAYKLKRAVHFDYANFSTLDLRRAACEGEVRLNHRTAPSLYLGVRPVTRESDGGLALGGPGTPVEWLVEMVRFDQNLLFDRLAERHQLDAGRMEGLADHRVDWRRPAAGAPRSVQERSRGARCGGRREQGQVDRIASADARTIRSGTSSRPRLTKSPGRRNGPARRVLHSSRRGIHHSLSS